MERNKGIERASREETRWKLARICRSEIEEMKKNSWLKNKEVRIEQARLEKEKKDRFRRIGEKINVNQLTLLEMMKKQPQKEKEIVEMQAEKSDMTDEEK